MVDSANLECRSEMCCTQLAASTGRKKVAKNRHLGTIAQLRRAISSQLRHVSTIANFACLLGVQELRALSFRQRNPLTLWIGADDSRWRHRRRVLLQARAPRCKHVPSSKLRRRLYRLPSVLRHNRQWNINARGVMRQLCSSWLDTVRPVTIDVVAVAYSREPEIALDSSG